MKTTKKLLLSLLLGCANMSSLVAAGAHSAPVAPTTIDAVAAVLETKWAIADRLLPRVQEAQVRVMEKFEIAQNALGKDSCIFGASAVLQFPAQAKQVIKQLSEARYITDEYRLTAVLRDAYATLAHAAIIEKLLAGNRDVADHPGLMRITGLMLDGTAAMMLREALKQLAPSMLIDVDQKLALKQAPPSNAEIADLLKNWQQLDPGPSVCESVIGGIVVTGGALLTAGLAAWAAGLL